MHERAKQHTNENNYAQT